MSYIKYIDVSEHQGDIDFAKMKGNVDGVIIRAGYGRNNIDKKFIRSVTECNRLGIPCGAYWFSYALSVDDAKNEANYFLSAIKPYRIELPVAWDYEYDSEKYSKNKGVKPTKQLVSDMARAFLQTCEASGYYAMNYTNPAFGKTYFDDQVFNRFDLWLAQWPNKWTEDSKPQMSCGIWQYGGTTVPGIQYPVDTNRSYKDYYSFLRKTVAKEYSDGEDTVIEYTKPTAPAEDKVLTWAKGLGFDTTDMDKTVTKEQMYEALYDYDEKRYSGLLSEE